MTLFNLRKSIITNAKKESLLDIHYYLKAEQNITCDRNKAVKSAKMNLIAFIDDDEFPANSWLSNLNKRYNLFR